MKGEIQKEEKIVSLDEVSSFCLFLCITKKHLLGTNLIIEYKKW